MNVRKAKHCWIFTLVFTLISIAYVFPIALVVINSFKKKAYISKKPFAIPTDKMFVGIENYIKGIQRTGFIDAFFFNDSDWWGARSSFSYDTGR